MLSPAQIARKLDSDWLKPWAVTHESTPLIQGAQSCFVYKQILNHTLKIHHIPALDPHGQRLTDPAPALVFFFGGGWSSYNPSHFAPQASALAELGIHGFLVEYRTLKRFEADAGLQDAPHRNDMFSVFKCISDARSAMRYVRANAQNLGVDTERLGAGGGSAGGHLALSVNLMPYDDPQDDLSISSHSDLLLLFNPVCDTTAAGYGHGFDPRNPDESLSFDPPAFLDHPDAKLPPMLVQHGKADTTTPLENAIALDQHWRERNQLCQLHLFNEAKHGFFNRGDHYIDTLKNTIVFLQTRGWIQS